MIHPSPTLSCSTGNGTFLQLLLISKISNTVGTIMIAQCYQASVEIDLIKEINMVGNI